MRRNDPGLPRHGFRPGDLVFVYPEEAAAPREVRGLDGVVEAVVGSVAKVVFRDGRFELSADVEAAVLRIDRRRRGRATARWGSEALAATA